jgi:hypothetical protein
MAIRGCFLSFLVVLPLAACGNRPSPGNVGADDGASNGTSACVVTGCSSQLCASEETASTCEHRPEYDCYKAARCARQSDGTCGWAMTPELSGCLSSAGK